MSAAPLVEARGLVRTFPVRGARRDAPRIRAVDGVDLAIAPGEVVGLVGESGSGKSTLGRLLVRLLEPDAGGVRFEGEDLLALPPRALRERRRRFQIVFQDAHGALNPRMRVGDLVAEPLIVHRLCASAAERRERVRDLLAEVGLDADAADRHPHEFSGGQRQRIGIARAIACRPRFLVADEPVSALDPPVQAQIVNLLLDLKEKHGLALLLVAHDIRLVGRVCDRVAVMYLGRVVEEGPAEAVVGDPVHPYSRALVASAPGLVPGRPTPAVLDGEPPSPTAIPVGCRFRPRCPEAVDACRDVDPALETVADRRRAACIRVDAGGR